MKIKTKKLATQQAFEFDVFYGKLVMRHELKELIMESIALYKVKDFDNIPILDYIETAANNNRYANKARYDLELILQEGKDLVEQLKNESNFQAIRKEFIYNNLNKIFRFFYIDNEKYAFNDEIDESGAYVYFPFRIKDFINEAYMLCEKIFAVTEGNEFSDLLNAHVDQNSEQITFVNRALIFAKVLLGKIRSGRDITRLLFERIPKNVEVPQSFQKLCRIKNGRYKIFNTDYKTLNFQLAVLDLIQFADFSNKLLFNNKLNNYLKNR